MPMNKTTALRLIRRNASVKQRNGPDYRLHIAEHDGQLWATNAYWCAPASWFTGLVLPETVTPGTYDAKTGDRVTDDTLNISNLWPADDMPVIEPVTIHGSCVLLDHEPHALALYASAPAPAAPEDAEPKHVAFDARYLGMFRDKIMEHRARGAEMQVRQASPNKPATIYQATDYTRAYGSKETGPTKGWRLCGLLMAVRLS